MLEPQGTGLAYYTLTPGIAVRLEFGADSDKIHPGLGHIAKKLIVVCAAEGKRPVIRI